jgi:hypothetical protein
MNKDKEILDMLDNITIDENEFNHIDVELTDIEKRRIKKTYRKNIKENKSLSKKIAIAAALIMCITASIVSTQPVMASNIPVLSSIYETLGIYDEYKDYTKYIGESIKVKNYTYTIEQLMVTPYKSLMTVKITSDTKFPEDHRGFMIGPSIGGVHWNSGSGGEHYKIDDYTIIQTIEHNYNNRVPKKSTIKINIHSMDDRDIDSNGNFEFKADFDRSYTEFESLPVKNVNIDKFGINVKEINSSIMGTDIVSKLRFKDNSEQEYMKKNDTLEFALQLDDDIYGGLKASSTSTFLGYVTGTLKTQVDSLSVNTLKKAKNISLLVYESRYTTEELVDMTTDEERTEQETISSQNVSFNPYLNFDEDKKGEFYGLERNDDTIKLHYKGDENNLISLTNSCAWSKSNSRKFYFCKVYRDPNKADEFILEFDGVPNDLQVSINTYSNIHNSHTFLNEFKIK